MPTWNILIHQPLPIASTNLDALPLSEQMSLSQTFDRTSNNVQAQQHLRLSCLGQHNLIGGFDYLSCPGVSQRQNLTDTIFMGTLKISESQLQTDFWPPQWSYSFYLLDYWRPFKGLVLELGLFKDFNKAVIPFFQQNIYTSLWSPRFGANYQFGVNGTQHVLRAALGRYLNTHLITQPLLVPAETASFPWAIDSWLRYGDPPGRGCLGGPVELPDLHHLAPERPAAFHPHLLHMTTTTGLDHPMWQTWKRYQASFVLNRILFTSLGLSLGVMGKRVIPDLSYAADGLESYSEFNAFIGLAYLHPQGWLARIRPLLVQQYGKITGHTADNPFVILNLTVGPGFPQQARFRPFRNSEPL